MKRVISVATATAGAVAPPVRAHADASPADFNLRTLRARLRQGNPSFTDLRSARAAGCVMFPDQNGDCVDQPG